MPSQPYPPEPLVCAAVLALQEPGKGKTRFTGLSPRHRSELAVAMALDAVRALREVVTTVIIVSDALSPMTRRTLEAEGVRLVAEPRRGAGLNAALTAGIATSAPDALVLAGVGDLPSLTSTGVRFVLEEARSGPVAVPDADGVGTTMIAGAGRVLRPCFGPASAARHRELGYRLLTQAPATVRRDADDATALAEAVRLGVGPSTAALLQRASWWTRQVPAGKPAGTCRRN